MKKATSVNAATKLITYKWKKEVWVCTQEQEELLLTNFRMWGLNLDEMQKSEYLNPIMIEIN